MKIITSTVAFLALTSGMMAGGAIVAAPAAIPFVVSDENYQEADGLYIGAAYSHMSHDIDFLGSTINAEHDYTSLMLSLGYKFNPYIALEGRYNFSLGDNDNDDLTQNSEISVLSLFVKPTYPLAPEMDIYALLGYSMVESDNDADATSVDESAFAWGVGTAYMLTEEFSIFIDYTQYYNDTSRNFDHVIDSFNAGVHYTF